MEPRTVLVVEDDPADTRLLGEILLDAFGEETRVLSHHTIQEATRTMRSERVDVVLLDLHLPDSAGADSVTEIHKAKPRAPIVVVTHLEDTDASLECIDAGAQDYILKSELSPKQLRRAVLHGIERMELQKATSRAMELESDLASLTRHAKEAILLCDRDGRILAWNPAAESLYGIPAPDAIGLSIERIVPEESRQEFRKNLARLIAGEVLPVATAVRLGRDGREVEVEESLFRMLDESGEPTRFAAVARDRTELARLRRMTQFLTDRASPAAVETGELPRTTSPRMREMYQASCLVAQNPSATVLLLGETGVGKGWLARFLHSRSPRAGKPFLEINCAGLAPQLVESELFGHEKGSFTGATSQKRGLVEAAEGGTLFLDEIGELPAEVQAQLLTFLDSRTFRRVGGNRTLSADVRLIAATNRDLRTASDSGQFRSDLYYRLSVFPIEVPPLRDRKGDIPMLAQDLLDDMLGRSGRPVFELEESVFLALQSYEWPGNIRELRNAIERALILSRGDRIEERHLPAEVRGEGRATDANRMRLEDVERAHILQVLEMMEDNRTRAAEALGISRSTLRRKLARISGNGAEDGEYEGEDDEDDEGEESRDTGERVAAG